MFQRGKIEEIQHTALLLEDTPASTDSFAYCQSMRTRRRRRLPTQMPMAALTKLKAWVLDPSSSVILAQGQGVKTSSLDFAVDFLEAVRERNYPVVWSLRSNVEPGRAAPPVIAILRSLISQILELETGLGQARADGWLTLANFKNVTTVRQWLDLLERCVSAVPRLFIVVDMATIEEAVCDNDDDDDTYGPGYFTAKGFFEHLTGMVNRRKQGGLKIMVISWGLDAAVVSSTLDSTTDSDISDDMRIFTDMGRKVQRLMRQPKYRAFYKKRQQQFGQGFQSAFGQRDEA